MIVEVAAQQLALEQAAEVDGDVVALDLEERGARLGLVPGQAGADEDRVMGRR